MLLTDALRELSITYKEGGEHYHVTNGWVGIDCPTCSPNSGKFKFGIHPSFPNGGTCWTCGPKNTIGVLSLVASAPPAVVRGILAGLDVAPQKKRKPATGTYSPPYGVEEMGDAHKRYLRKRGFDPEQIEKLWKVQGIRLHSHLSWRLFIPIYHHSQAVSWTTRATGTKGMRYISSKPEEESIPHRDLLYGSDMAGHSVVIVEGPTDVWRIGPGAVATMGVNYTSAQLRLMAEYPVRAICFDAEPSAQRRAAKLVSDLRPFSGTTHNIELETGADAAEADPKEIEEIRRVFLQ